MRDENRSDEDGRAEYKAWCDEPDEFAAHHRLAFGAGFRAGLAHERARQADQPDYGDGVVDGAETITNLNKERMRALPDDLRERGWAVAVHNDYRLHGEAHTFWLFTNGDRCVKGEGRTDAEALDQIRAALDHPAPIEPEAGCECRRIQAEDRLRHFKGCPLRRPLDPTPNLTEEDVRQLAREVLAECAKAATNTLIQQERGPSALACARLAEAASAKTETL